MPRTMRTARKSVGGKVPRHQLAARTPQLPPEMLPGQVRDLEEEHAEWTNKNKELMMEEEQDARRVEKMDRKHQRKEAALKIEISHIKEDLQRLYTEAQQKRNTEERLAEQLSRAESRFRRSAAQLAQLHHYTHHQHTEYMNDLHNLHHAQETAMSMSLDNQHLWAEIMQLIQQIQALQPVHVPPAPPGDDGPALSGLDSEELPSEDDSEHSGDGSNDA